MSVVHDPRFLQDVHHGATAAVLSHLRRARLHLLEACDCLVPPAPRGYQPITSPDCLRALEQLTHTASFELDELLVGVIAEFEQRLAEEEGAS